MDRLIDRWMDRLIDGWVNEERSKQVRADELVTCRALWKYSSQLSGDMNSDAVGGSDRALLGDEERVR
jgi:hypothetical protein